MTDIKIDFKCMKDDLEKTTKQVSVVRDKLRSAIEDFLGLEDSVDGAYDNVEAALYDIQILKGDISKDMYGRKNKDEVMSNLMQNLESMVDSLSQFA